MSTPPRPPNRNVVPANRPAAKPSESPRNRPGPTLPITERAREELLADMREAPLAEESLEMEIQVSDDEEAPPPKKSSTNAHVAPRRTK